MKAKRTLKDYINAVAFVEDFRIKNCHTDNIGPAVQLHNPKKDSIVRATHAALLKLGYMNKSGEYYTRASRWNNNEEVAKAVMDYVLESSRKAMADFNARKREAQQPEKQHGGRIPTSVIVDEKTPEEMLKIITIMEDALTQKGYKRDENGRWFKEVREYL